MTTRDEYEAWLLEVHLLTATWNERRNCFDEYPAHLAFCAWQAATKKEREACISAIEAEREPDDMDSAHVAFNSAIESASDAVRSRDKEQG